MGLFVHMSRQLIAGRFALSLKHPQVMGILNVTPDSFSDGGQFARLDDALEHAEQMLAAGADIIDIGGESTRPGAEEVSAEQELDRVVPVIDAIADRFDVPVSVDTSKPEVMSAAVAAGAVLINDVRALSLPGALSAAAALDVPVCLMHMQGQPLDMQQAPEYEDVVTDVVAFLRGRMRAALDAGINTEQIVLDPGFGFGKSHPHNFQLLRELGQFKDLGCPLLVGLSRKSMIGAIIEREAADRVAASVALAVLAAERGADIIRVHDVKETCDGLAMLQALKQE